MVLPASLSLHNKRRLGLYAIVLGVINAVCSIVSLVSQQSRAITVGFGVAAVICAFAAAVISHWERHQSQSLNVVPERERTSLERHELIRRTNVSRLGQQTPRLRNVAPFPTAALSLMKEAAGAVPVAGLDGIPELALEIVKMTESALNNQSAFRRLAKQSSDLACFVVDTCRKEHEPEEDVSLLLESHIASVTRTLEEIREFAQLAALHESSDQHEIFETDRKAIDDYLEKLDNSRRQFQNGIDHNLLSRSMSEQEEIEVLDSSYQPQYGSSGSTFFTGARPIRKATFNAVSGNQINYRTKVTKKSKKGTLVKWPRTSISGE